MSTQRADMATSGRQTNQHLESAVAEAEQRFCNSGTEANLLCLATARAVTGKPAALIFDGAYHGSLLYFSHGGSPLNMPIPVIETPYNDTENAIRTIAENAAKVAAVIL